jgi:hypothetical protein
MNNIYSINSFFPEGILQNLDKTIKESGWNYGWKSNPSIGYGHWNIDFAPCIIENSQDISEYLPATLKEAWHYIKFNHFAQHKIIRCYANGHTFGVEGSPHTDSLKPEDKTIVVYLNNNWRREWGGETLIYQDDKIIHAEIPKRNRALIFPGNNLHISRGVTRICPDLRITLMFKVSDAFDQERDRLQEFLINHKADTIPHNNGKLINHLLRTYDRLKNTRHDKDICLGGGLHSIFGTNAFKTQILNISNKQLVIDWFGEKAVEYAVQFSSIDRPNFLEKNIDTNTELNALASIECANLLDQGGLEKYPRLNAYWQGLLTPP